MKLKLVNVRVSIEIKMLYQTINTKEYIDRTLNTISLMDLIGYNN